MLSTLPAKHTRGGMTMTEDDEEGDEEEVAAKEEIEYDIKFDVKFNHYHLILL